jgi:hypothetical protein
MVDFSDGSVNLRIDGSMGGTDLDFWFGRAARASPAARPSFGQMIGRETRPSLRRARKYERLRLLPCRIQALCSREP